MRIPLLYSDPMATWLRRMLSVVFGGSQSRDGGLFLYVQCNTCSEIISVRINPASDLVQEFNESDETVSGYSLHKELIGRGAIAGQACFRLLRLDATFDKQRRLLDGHVDGGKLVNQNDYISQQENPTEVGSSVS